MVVALEIQSSLQGFGYLWCKSVPLKCVCEASAFDEALKVEGLREWITCLFLFKTGTMHSRGLIYGHW